MCEKKQFKYCPSQIDKCMVEFISTLEAMGGRIIPVASCCGHGKYKMSVIVRNSTGTCWDLITGKIIPRKKRFYRRDKEGYYYVPEISEEK